MTKMNLKRWLPEKYKYLSVRDMHFVYYKCPQAEKLVRLHTHLNQISFTLSGKRTIHHGDQSWTLTKDTAYLLKRTGYMQEMHQDISGWELMAFYLRDDFLIQTVNDFRTHLPLQSLPSPTSEKIIKIHVNENIRSSFYSLIPYFNLDKKPAEQVIEMKFKELLYNIFTEPKNQAILTYVINLGDEPKIPIWEIMESNYMYNMSLEEFAHISNRSIASFKREFKDYYKTSPGKWLTQRRLEQARLLLKSSKKPVSEIIFLCGFENLSHFSRIFREKFGMSPSQYRKP